MESILSRIDDLNGLGDKSAVQSSENPTFADVFSDIINTAVDANAQKSQDMIDVMLGNTDDIEGIQMNIAKAEVATELLVTVKNSVVDAYNEIIRMQI
jgi:flagellar hook-basal body complex protein FliE